MHQNAESREISIACRGDIIENLRHHTHRLRMSSLSLLLLDTNTKESKDIVAKLLDAESIPISLNGVRDRLLKIRRLELSVKSAEDARFATLWLLGIVNLLL
jgi:hypothetical protein